MWTDGTEVTLDQVVYWTVLLAVAAWLSFLVYRAMDRPRLVLHETPEGPRASRRDTIQYIVSMPVLITLWWIFFFVVFLVSDNHVNVAQLFIFPSALILAIRALAFLSPPTAHELGKVLPVALVAFVILDGSWRGPDEFAEMFGEATEVETDWLVLVFVLFADYLFTAIWYWGWIRWGQPHWQARKARRSGEHVAHDDRGVAVLADADGADGRA